MVSAKSVLIALAAVMAAVVVDAAEEPAALKPVLNKTYKLHSSENFEDVMRELGVGWITRKLGSAASPVIELTYNNGEYSLTSKSTFKDTDLRFRIDQEFDEETPDGRMVKSVVVQNGNVLTHTQKGEKVTTIVRTFTPEEVKMVVKVGDIVSTRIYKPQ